MTGDVNWKGGGKCPGTTPDSYMPFTNPRKRRQHSGATTTEGNHFSSQDDHGHWEEFTMWA